MTTPLTWENGVVLTDQYSGKFSIEYQTSTEKGAWRLYFKSYKGDKITYELYEGSMEDVIVKGMSLFNGVKAKTTTLEDINGNMVV